MRSALVVGVVALALAVAGCSTDEQPARSTTTTVKNADRTGGAGVVPEPLPDTTVPAGAVELSGLKFTDVTGAAGLDRDRSTRDLFGEDGMTGGVSVVDVDAATGEEIVLDDESCCHGDLGRITEPAQRHLRGDLLEHLGSHRGDR